MSEKSPILFLAVFLAGCAAPGDSVRLTDAARSVHVLKDSAVGCEEVGPIEISTGGKVIGLRSRGDYESSLIEARERAARMGADSIVVEGSESYPATGEHRLSVRAYKCR